jgi:hypothetical protein
VQKAAGIGIIIIEVVERRRRDGVFIARLENGTELCISRQPFLDGARVLQLRGIPSGTRITMRHGTTGTDSLSSIVGAAAKLSVRESDGDRMPRFIPYQPHPRGAA